METNTVPNSSTIQITHTKTHSNDLLKQAIQKSKNEILTLISKKGLPDKPFSEHTVTAEIHQTDETMNID